MNELLTLALAAHGGLERWESFTTMRAQLVIGGALWHDQGQPGLLGTVSYEAELHRPRVQWTPFDGVGRHSEYMPERVSIVDDRGALIISRNAPRLHFSRLTHARRWDKLDALYFSSYALWQYLSAPFLYTSAGFAAEEIAPWEENGEMWRRLKISFPADGAWHHGEQVAYFGPDFLLRRHDYTVDVLRGASWTDYLSNYRHFQGILVPATRRVYGRDRAGRAIAERLLVSIDIADLCFD